MKTISITGSNYFGYHTGERTACRCIIVQDDKLLLSYETVTGQWMIPGGGLEPDESERECCIREIAEETGKVAEVSECVLRIDEYYEDMNFVSLYFIGRITGETERGLTAREKAVGMEPRWISIEDAIDVFSRHNDYAASDEMRRGLYLREYTALTAIRAIMG